jgi:hypothetical protein
VMPHSSGRRQRAAGISTFSTWLKFNCWYARTWPFKPATMHLYLLKYLCGT